MGAIINIADRKVVGKKLRPEKFDYLLVPARILEPLARLDASVDAFAADHSNTGVGLDWDAYYRVVAILELSTKYRYSE